MGGGSDRSRGGPTAAALAEFAFHEAVALLCVVDADGIVHLFNASCERLTGRTNDAIRDTILWESVVALDDRESVREAVRLAIVQNTVTRANHRWLSSDGTPQRIAWTYSPSRHPASETTYVVVSGIITPQGAAGAWFGEPSERAGDEAFRQSEATSKAILQAVPDLMFRMSERGEVLEYYAANDALLYAPPDDIIGRPLDQLVPSTVAVEAMRCLNAALRDGGVHAHEYQLEVPGGSRYFESRLVATGIRNEVLGIVRDITLRKRWEGAVRDSERQYRMLMERASDGILIANAEGQLLSANQQACAMLGYPESTLLTMRLTDFVCENDADATALFGGQEQGETALVERRLRRGNGAFVDVEVSSTVMPDGRLQGILRDVTERKRAVEALRRSEESFRRLIERSPGVVVVHRGGVIVYANEAAATALGYGDPKELVGVSALDIVHPEDKGVVVERIARQLETGEPVPLREERYLRRDGTLLYVEVAGIPLDFQGELSTIVVGHDITERKRTERERIALEVKLQHAQKLESLGVLAGGIAHDFNNLLMGVLGNAGLALMELAPESPARGSLKRIETSAHRAAELTKQLLAYSGKGKFVVQPLNISKLVEEMVHLLETVVSKKAVLRLTFSPDLPLIEGDATQMRQIVMNLITNASDALGDQDGVIMIRTGTAMVDQAYLADTVLDADLEEGEYVFVEVSDTGCGMPHETAAKIFDPFYTTKFTGRGLGLAAVLGIVRGHRGTVKVYSEPGHGTCFKILLPKCDADAVAPTARLDAGRRWTGRGLVLVVDDEEIVRSVAQTVLEKQGFEVITADDGEQGVAVFRERADEIQLVLLDMTMPRMSGEEAFAVIRRIRPHARVLLTSGYNEQEAIGSFTGKGLAGFIQKPYTPSELLARIRSVLDAGETTR